MPTFVAKVDENASSRDIAKAIVAWVKDNEARLAAGETLPETPMDAWFRHMHYGYRKDEAEGTDKTAADMAGTDKD